MPRIAWKDVIDQLAHVDDPDVLERVRENWALRFALEMARPQNWWGLGIDPETLLDIAEQDGLPLAWVPRKELILELTEAKDSGARRAVLKARTLEIVDDVQNALAEVRDPWIVADVNLATRAMSAFTSGHHEAAMALAVSLGEPLATWASTPRVRGFDSKGEREAWEEQRQRDGKYKWARTELSALRADLRPLDVKRAILIAPIPRFFSPWFRESGELAPEMLSRHVVAHQPTADHMTPENAIVSLMLVASILRDQQEWCREVRSTEEHPDDY